VPNSAVAQSAERRGTPATDSEIKSNMLGLSMGAVILKADRSRGERVNTAAEVFEGWVRDPQAWRDAATLAAFNSKSPPSFDPEDPAISDERIRQAANTLAVAFREMAPTLDPK
jgi:hypothetical protein